MFEKSQLKVLSFYDDWVQKQAVKKIQREYQNRRRSSVDGNDEKFINQIIPQQIAYSESMLNDFLPITQKLKPQLDENGEFEIQRKKKNNLIESSSEDDEKENIVKDRLNLYDDDEFNAE